MPDEFASDVLKKLDQLHGTWFGEDPGSGVSEQIQKLWFGKEPELDRMLEQRFGAFHTRVTEKYRGMDVDKAINSGRRTVSFIVLLDQVTRNLYRDTPEAYKNDEWALECSKRLVQSGRDRNRLPVERVFVYMPYQHSEGMNDQERSVELYENLKEDVGEGWQNEAEEFLDYARRHREAIREFGRFPHRNEILGRDSTPEEEEFLAGTGSRF